MLNLISGNYVNVSLIKEFLINNSGIINLIIAIIVSAVILLSVLFKKQKIFKQVRPINVKKETIKKVIPNLIYAVILTFIFALVLGYRPYIVTSGSMRPSIEPGAVVLIKSVKNIEELQVGDVITFSHSGSTNTTHQIIAIRTQGYFQEGEIIECDLNGETFTYTIKATGGNILTHGTANSIGNVDSPVTFNKHVKGKVCYTFWYVGLIIVTLKNQIISLLIVIAISYFAYKNYLFNPQYEI